eukprot:scaffold548938_cov52-Prasinocladus_malaysianus.AAC.1
MGSVKHSISIGAMDEVASKLREGFDINTVDYDGRTILHVAATSGDLKLVEMLVKEFHGNVSAIDRSPT